MKTALQKSNFRILNDGLSRNPWNWLFLLLALYEMYSLAKRKTTNFCFKNNAPTSFLVLILSQSKNSMTKWSASHRYLNIGADLLKRDGPRTIAISFHEEEGSYGRVSVFPQPHIVGRPFKHRRAQLDKRFPTKTLKGYAELVSQWSYWPPELLQYMWHMPVPAGTRTWLKIRLDGSANHIMERPWRRR